ncbi:hypothetical protein SDC9_135576 [bioreactor metagenome]|uniref:Uncharacterized protein n=1 Tax=bioreactor metagenome TaxID=1076179 RepID=A0A645DIP6_9ZZZZ
MGEEHLADRRERALFAALYKQGLRTGEDGAQDNSTHRQRLDGADAIQIEIKDTIKPHVGVIPKEWLVVVKIEFPARICAVGVGGVAGKEALIRTQHEETNAWPIHDEPLA